MTPPDHKDSHRSILKSTSIISLGTLSSRILGFIRDIIFAKLLGTGFRADAFFVAFRIPNLFRDLVGEGASNSAVVPVFSEYLEKKDKQELWRFMSVVLTLGIMLLTALTIVGMILAPYIVQIMAPGFRADPAKLALTIELTRMMFPYLIFIGLTAYGMAVLYTFRSFTVPAFSPCLLNIAMIVTTLMATQVAGEPSYILAVGVLIGGILQLLAHIRPVLKTGVQLRFMPDFSHPGARKIGRLLIPRLFGAGVYQMSILIDTLCASLAHIVGPGGISAIYYANRIIQFPMGVFTISLASAVLPTMSGQATHNNTEQFKKTLLFSLESIFFVMFPTSVMLMILAHPIIRILFERGQFDQYSTMITSWVLFYSAIGLFSFSGIKILVTAFYSLQDTKTPVKVAAVCLLLNAALNLVLMRPLKVGGIALASSIAATVDFLMLYYAMNKRLGGMRNGLVSFLWKVILAAFLSGAVVYWGWNNIGWSFEWGRLILVGIAGFVVYGLICYYLKVEQAHKIYQWLKERKKL